MTKKRKKISIPFSLFKDAENLAKKKNLDSVEKYIVQILDEKIAQEKDQDDKFSKEDEEKVKKRLKALGYMD
ncbi:MAG: CopG family transcriptional regulator [Candidatus Aminicenantes bacterium]|nr:CopG family transcriptional regulator [Candidatus Aminicenantes bacterium]